MKNIPFVLQYRSSALSRPLPKKGGKSGKVDVEKQLDKKQSWDEEGKN